MDVCFGHRGRQEHHTRHGSLGVGRRKGVFSEVVGSVPLGSGGEIDPEGKPGLGGQGQVFRTIL